MILKVFLGFLVAKAKREIGKKKKKKREIGSDDKFTFSMKKNYISLEKLSLF